MKHLPPLISLLALMAGVSATAQESQSKSLIRMGFDGPMCDRPAYPPAATAAEATGTTVVQYSVDSNQRLTSLRVVKSAGSTKEHRLLDRAVVEMISTCHFVKHDDPEPQTAKLEYIWKIAP